MKVLWLANSPVGANSYLNHNIQGGGWISALETRIKQVEGIELGVAFFYDNSNEFSFRHNDVTYYPVKTRHSSFSQKIRSKLYYDLVDSNTEALEKVISDFNPDIIQLFGTESGLGEVITKTRVPVIIHIQGFLNPCLSCWFPKGISQRDVLFNSNIQDTLLKKSFYSDYYIWKKRAGREELIVRNANYFFGRTDWDRRMVKLFNSQAKYYHCDELLRPAFYRNEWAYKKNGLLTLATTINPTLYKGLDTVLETAELLKETFRVKFQWKILGISSDNKLVQLLEKIKQKKFATNNVVFLGPKSEEGVVAELKSADIFIHPSHIDNSPNSVCEAMLMGIPVIASNVGGIPSLIEDKVTGFLFNSNDPFELASIILENASKELEVKEISRKSREIAKSRHNYETIITRVVDTYKQILNA